MSAMPRVRTWSRVPSPIRAIKVEAMAPTPWIRRPSRTAKIVWLAATTAEPSAKTSRDRMTTSRRPRRSPRMPKGTWKIAWVSP
jgi:hypothetical protein